MSLVTLCSVAGSPGVTTAALAFAGVWPDATGRGVLLVDADPAGSGILPGHLRGAMPGTGGVLRLASRHGELTADAVIEHCVALDGGQDRLRLLGVTSALEARSLSRVWHALAGLVLELDRLGIDVLVDAGRMEHVLEPVALLEHAGSAVIVLRSSLGGVMAGLAGLERLRDLRGPGRATAAVLVGEHQPYSETEVRRELGTAAPLPVLAWDPRAAARIDAGEALASSALSRSALLRSASAAIETIRPAELDLVGGAR